LKGEITQSSDFDPNHKGEKCNDGNTEGGVCATNSDTPTWIMVNLKSEYDLSLIKIW
jgi:hypothetical protein